MNKFIFILMLVLWGCQPQSHKGNPNSAERIRTTQAVNTHPDKPTVSFTFDDGITHDIVGYPFEEWNGKILSAMKEENIQAVFFVTGSNKLDEKGKYLLNSWETEGHKIANHTYTHPFFNSDKVTVADFEKELLQTDSVISLYDTYTKLFRFPYLKEGNTEEKIEGFRQVLKKHGYRNGYVTIDASDWFVNSELIKCLKKEGMNSPRIEKYKAFYVQHILERANYYEKLSFELNQRHIPHTLLLHHNLTSALFLRDLIRKFKEEGWEITDADQAFQDEIFNRVPDVNPAGESLIWSLAKETGKYEDELRYPAEDSRYEIPKMKAWELIDIK